MSEKDIRNLILLGVGGFAVYYLFFRKTAVALPFPASITVTPQITGTHALPAGSLSPQGFPATPDETGQSDTNYDYVLTE